MRQSARRSEGVNIRISDPKLNTLNAKPRLVYTALYSLSSAHLDVCWYVGDHSYLGPPSRSATSGTSVMLGPCSTTCSCIPLACHAWRRAASGRLSCAAAARLVRVSPVLAYAQSLALQSPTRLASYSTAEYVSPPSTQRPSLERGNRANISWLVEGMKGSHTSQDGIAKDN